MIADLTSGLAAPSRAIGDSRSRLACKANSLVSGSTLLVGLRPGVRNEGSAEQIREHLSSQFGMQVRPNHLGMALQRHRRAGRLAQRDGRWSMAQPASPGTGAEL